MCHPILIIEMYTNNLSYSLNVHLVTLMIVKEHYHVTIIAYNILHVISLPKTIYTPATYQL